MNKIQATMRVSGTLSGRKLAIMDSKVNRQSGRGLFATKKFSRREYITFFGFPSDEMDCYGTKQRLPLRDDHTYRFNGVYYDNASDAKNFKRKNSTCYVPDEQVGFSVGLGWAANSSKGSKCKANCVLKKIRTYPLCPHILCTDMRFAEMEYLVLEATRDILGGEEILHAYNLDGNVSRKRKRQS